MKESYFQSAKYRHIQVSVKCKHVSSNLGRGLYSDSHADDMGLGASYRNCKLEMSIAPAMQHMRSRRQAPHGRRLGAEFGRTEKIRRPNKKKIHFKTILSVFCLYCLKSDI